MTATGTPAEASRRVRVGVAVAAGVCLALGLPPVHVWVLGLVAVALLGWLFSTGTVGQSFRAGWLAGTVAILWIARWIIPLIPRFTGLPRVLGFALWLLAGGYMGLWLGVAGALTAWVAPVRGRALAATAALLVAERFGPSVFPMNLALPLVDMPWLAQSGDLVGVQGLGAVLLGTAVAVATASRARTRGTTVAAGAWVVGVLALAVYGHARIERVEAARDRAAVLRVGLVQPGIPATLRWVPSMAEPIRAHLWRLTGYLLGRSPDVVIWHEGAYPYRLPYRSGMDGETAPPALPMGRIPPWPTLVFGAVAVGPGERVYNATFARDPDGKLGPPVAKRVLVPFGEYIPGVRFVPFLRRVFGRAEGLQPGDRPEFLRAAGTTLGVLNCFEDTIPWAGAEVARADLLVNVTNDAWFDGAAPAQHMMNARWRTIESRRDLVRAVNNGYSAHIDALGRVVAVMPPGRPAAEMVYPRVGMQLHPWAPRTVTVAPWVALVALMGAGGAAGLRRLRARRNV